MTDIVRNIVIHEFDFGKVVNIEFTNEAHVELVAGWPYSRVTIFKPTDDDLRRIQHGLGEVK
jgi:hypothetical protein